MNPSGLTILADQVIPLEDLNTMMLAQEIKDAEEDLADAGEDPVRRRVAETRLNELKDLQRWMIPV